MDAIEGEEDSLSAHPYSQEDLSHLLTWSEFEWTTANKGGGRP